MIIENDENKKPKIKKNKVKVNKTQKNETSAKEEVLDEEAAKNRAKFYQGVGKATSIAIGSASSSFLGGLYKRY